jgi:hypothetical protein
MAAALTRFGKDMSRPAFSALLLSAVLLLAASCEALATTIQDPDMVVLPDPVLSKSVRFPASAATAGVARIGPALDQANPRAAGCSARKPCAVATPASSDAAMVAPARQRVSKNRRVRQAG